MTPFGCSSILSIQLIVDSIVNSISVVNFGALQADQNSAQYQWIQCDSNYQTIANATNQFWTPTLNGTFAVIISQGTCFDTSDCLLVHYAGEKELSNSIEIYPNPAVDEIHISAPGYSIVRLLETSGKCIQKEDFESTITIDIDVPTGMYLLELTGKQGSVFRYKILIQ